MSLGGRGVQEEDGSAVTYLMPPDDPETCAAEAGQRLRDRLGEVDLEVSWWWQRQEDWDEYWKRGLDVRRLTDRLVVHPSWLLPQAGPDDLVIQLDPGMAFGTAEHGTTRGCLRLLDRRVQPGQRVLDVGAGSGILSIAAAKMGAASVVAVELDPLACSAAVENVETNQASDLVDVQRARVTPAWLEAQRPFDGIIANLETHLLVPLIPSLFARLTEGGWVLLSGILGHERGAVLDVVSRTGGVLQLEDRDGEWWTGSFRGAS